MAEAMQPWFYTEHRPPQSSAPLPVVQYSQRWSVRDQDVRIRRNGRIEPFAIRFVTQPESPSVQRSCRAAPDAQTFDLHCLIQKESGVAQPPTPFLWICFYGELVIASRANAISGRLLAEPPVEVVNL